MWNDAARIIVAAQQVGATNVSLLQVDSLLLCNVVPQNVVKIFVRNTAALLSHYRDFESFLNRHRNTKRSVWYSCKNCSVDDDDDGDVNDDGSGADGDDTSSGTQVSYSPFPFLPPPPPLSPWVPEDVDDNKVKILSSH